MSRNVVVVAIITLLITAAPSSIIILNAYGQAAGPEQNVEITGMETIRSEIVNRLYSVVLIDYRLYENGTAIYLFAPVDYSGNLIPGNNQEIEVRTAHGATAEFGYKFQNGTIFSPQGKRVIVETFPVPPELQEQYPLLPLP